MLNDQLAMTAHFGGAVEDGLQIQRRAVSATVALDAKNGLLGSPVFLQPLSRRFYFQQLGQASQRLEDRLGGSHTGETHSHL
jgi:hypothetical protein